MKSLKYAIKKMMPFALSYVFVGLASGILLINAGYSPTWAFLSALLIYAGSMQIVMVAFMTSGTPLYMIAIMALFINARHIFYGISFIDEFRSIGRQSKSRWKYPYMALTMTDETYAVLCSLKCPADLDKREVAFNILFLSHILWVISCLLGAFIGNALYIDMAGIEFSATAFFTAVVVYQLRECKSYIPAIAGFTSSVLFFFLIGPDNFILPALSVSMIILIVFKDYIHKKTLGGNNE
ncbi:MAG: AzlC family ABC transporter permease [Treponema sp.]|nr:AzlC family ABC transporter permease [Treponema sp.]